MNKKLILLILIILTVVVVVVNLPPKPEKPMTGDVVPGPSGNGTKATGEIQFPEAHPLSPPRAITMIPPEQKDLDTSAAKRMARKAAKIISSPDSTKLPATNAPSSLEVQNTSSASSAGITMVNKKITHEQQQEMAKKGIIIY